MITFAFATEEWFDLFSNTILQLCPVFFSDPALILLNAGCQNIAIG